MYCNKCGNEIESGAAFCPNCGAPAETNAVNMTAPAAETPGDSGRQASAKGKSKKPFVIGIVVVVIVIVVIVVTTMLLSGQESKQQPAAPSSSSAASASSNSSSSGSSSSSSSTSSVYANYVGEWKGTLTETTGLGKSHCYGAEGKEMILDIKEISSTGRMTLSATFMYHGHKMDSTAADATTMQGDEMVTFENLTGTFSEKGFDLKIPLDQTNCEADIEITFENSSRGKAMKAVVTNEFNGSRSVIDTYTLTKEQG